MTDTNDSDRAFLTRLQWILLTVTAALGVAVILLGFLAPPWTAPLGAVLQAGGGALLGACVSIAIAAAIEKPTLLQVRDALKEVTGVRFLSKGDDLERIARDWHFYHRTHDGDDEIWMHHYLRLVLGRAKNTLRGRIELTNPRNGSLTVYLVEAGVRDERLMIFFTREGRGEDAAIFVFPKIPTISDKPYAGIGVLDYWNEKCGVSPVLISADPLISVDEAGQVKGPEAAKLRRRWGTQVNEVFAGGHPFGDLG